MSPTRFASLLGVLAVALAAGANAQTLIEADAAKGSELYTTQCMSCHGSAGNSVVPAQPILAGQYADYVVDQLIAYRDKTRDNALMYPFASTLSDEDMRNIAVYLEGQQAGLSGATDEALVLQGQALYRNGIPAKGVPNCTGCHGPTGAGIPPLYPRLSGQHAVYTSATLTELRDGARPSDVMNVIAAQLSDDEIAALSEYIAGLY